MNDLLSVRPAFWPRLVAAAAAALLLAAAGFKGYALYFHPFTGESLFESRTADLAVLELEVVLAFWLLTGIASSVAWSLTSLLFGAFSIANILTIFEGRTRCGCFGELPVSPWITLGLDLVIALSFVGLIRATRNRRNDSAREVAEGQRGHRPFFAVCWVCALAAGVGLFVFWLDHAGAKLLAQLRGESLTITPPVTKLGDCARAEEREFVVTVANHSDQPIQLLGGRADCGCVATTDLPLTVPARESRGIRVTLRTSDNPGRFRHGFWLFTGASRQPLAIAWFVGHVR